MSFRRHKRGTIVRATPTLTSPLEASPRVTSRPWNDVQAVTTVTPIATTVLLQGANVSQLVRMWTERSARGQSLVAWLMVFVALLAWTNFYRVIGQRVAFWSTLFGVGMNAAVWMTVVYFRYWVPAA